jgi:hypothetical protein
VCFQNVDGTNKRQHTVFVSIPQKGTTRDDGTSTRHDSMGIVPRAAVFGAAVWCPGGTHVTCWR